VNLVYKKSPYFPAAGGFGDNDAQFLADNGFNVVRLGFAWSAAEPQPGCTTTTTSSRMGQLGATNWPPKHIKGLHLILRIEALNCDVTVGVTDLNLRPFTPASDDGGIEELPDFRPSLEPRSRNLLFSATTIDLRSLICRC